MANEFTQTVRFMGLDFMVTIDERGDEKDISFKIPAPVNLTAHGVKVDLKDVYIRCEVSIAGVRYSPEYVPLNRYLTETAHGLHAAFKEGKNV